MDLDKGCEGACAVSWDKTDGVYSDKATTAVE